MLAPPSRTDSQATLVDLPAAPPPASQTVPGDNDMEVDADHDDGLPLQKRSPLATTCRASRRTQPAAEDQEGDGGGRRGQCAREPPLPVSVAANPRPKEPVASRHLLSCSKYSSGHEWRVTVANATSRRYLCLCGYEVREKKNHGYWAPVSAILSEPAPRSRRSSDEASEDIPSRPGPGTRSQVRVMRSTRSKTATASGSMLALPPFERPIAEESDSEDSMSIYESAVEDGSPMITSSSLASLPPPRRSSGGTTSSDAPSSLVDLPPMRRLPGRPGSDVSSPLVRPRQVSSRRVSSRTAEVSATPTMICSAECLSPIATGTTDRLPAERCLLVSVNPKPASPVATAVPRCQAAQSHHWKVWGNGSCRRYTCTHCSHVVKERKVGCPETWAPSD
ncbi:hypothetical protein OH77DRAFT_791642 [Trametes cingulata]|nr:hypothetical protein OH77DRAFT_791642 [Trametes cingulata]